MRSGLIVCAVAWSVAAAGCDRKAESRTPSGGSPGAAASGAGAGTAPEAAAVLVQRAGNVTVTVVSASLQVPAVSLDEGRSRTDGPKQMVVRLHVQNDDPNRKVDFSGWTPFLSVLSDAAVATDEFGNRYSVTTLGYGETFVGGTLHVALYPGKGADDVVAFEVPVATAKTFKVALSAVNVGGGETSTLRFEIPASMWQAKPSTRPAR